MDIIIACTVSSIIAIVVTKHYWEITRFMMKYTPTFYKFFDWLCDKIIDFLP